MLYTLPLLVQHNTFKLYIYIYIYIYLADGERQLLPQLVQRPHVRPRHVGCRREALPGDSDNRLGKRITGSDKRVGKSTGKCDSDKRLGCAARVGARVSAGSLGPTARLGRDPEVFRHPSHPPRCRPPEPPIPLYCLYTVAVLTTTVRVQTKPAPPCKRGKAEFETGDRRHPVLCLCQCEARGLRHARCCALPSVSGGDGETRLRQEGGGQIGREEREIRMEGASDSDEGE